MRFLFLLVFLAGLALGVGYPVAVSNFSGEEFAAFRVFERGTGFRPVAVEIDASQAPVRVLVDMVVLSAYRPARPKTALTLTVDAGGRTVLAEPITFAQTEPKPDSPQAQSVVFRDEAGVIDPVRSGPHLFTAGPGDAEDIDLREVVIRLRGGAATTDRRVLTAGYSMIAAGLVGFVLAVRRRRRQRRDAAPPPRWGRNQG